MMTAFGINPLLSSVGICQEAQLKVKSLRLSSGADPAGYYEVSCERLTKLVEAKDVEDLADAGGVSRTFLFVKADCGCSDHLSLVATSDASWS